MPGLSDELRERARSHPDRVAFVTGDTQITYGDLDRRVDRVAAALAAAGVGPGDRVAILDRNSARYPEQLYGAARIGAVQVPVNYRLAPDEVTYIVNDAQVKVLVAGPEFVPVLDAIAGRLKHTSHLLVIDGSGHLYDDYAAWIDAAPDAPPEHTTDTADVFVQLYSSGTTGLPKGAMLTHANFLTAMAANSPAWNLDDASTIMIAMPMYHVAGFVLTIMVVHHGVAGAIVREPDPVRIARDIERHGVTHVFLVPALLQFMQTNPEVAARDLSGLRLLLYGASPISEGVLRGAMRMLPGTGFIQVYGLTEVSGAITMLHPEDHDPDGPNTHRLRSAGVPNATCALKIVDPATQEELPRGRVGEIICRTPQNMKGYWADPEATAAALSDGNWFRTGDAGYLDEDGYVYLTDRVKDMIISGGENVYPAEVENILMAHPAVDDCAVIGVPDDTWGETPKAIVVLSKDAPDHDIIDHCRNHLAHYKCPTSVERRDTIPRNATGKILKRDLRAPYWESKG